MLIQFNCTIIFWFSDQPVIYDKEKYYKSILNRTDNALERYNQYLNDKVTLPYLDLCEFVAILEETGRNQVTRLEYIRYGKTRTPNYKDLILDNI